MTKKQEDPFQSRFTGKMKLQFPKTLDNYLKKPDDLVQIRDTLLEDIKPLIEEKLNENLTEVTVKDIINAFSEMVLNKLKEYSK